MEHGDTLFLKRCRQLPGQSHGTAAQLLIEAVLEQDLKLDAQQPPLGQHTAHALDHVPEVLLDGRVGDNHRLAKQGPYLGAADVKHIGQPGQVGESYIVFLCPQAVAAPGPVNVQGAGDSRRRPPGCPPARSGE